MLEIVFFIFDGILILAYLFWEYLKVYETKQEAFQWFVVLQFTILIIYLIFRSSLDRRRIRKHEENIIEKIDALRPFLSNNTQAITEDQFYVDFRADIARATSSVDITHLDTQPPQFEALSQSEMDRYYKEFARIIRSRSNVRFRRVERASLEKREWIEGLVRELSGRRNFSLACLITSEVDRKVPQVSVQVIDKNRCYIVALREHVDAHGPRDIRISDPSAAAIWLDYYNRALWTKSLVVLESGTLNAENWAEVRRCWGG